MKKNNKPLFMRVGVVKNVRRKIAVSRVCEFIIALAIGVVVWLKPTIIIFKRVIKNIGRIIRIRRVGAVAIFLSRRTCTRFGIRPIIGSASPCFPVPSPFFFDEGFINNVTNTTKVENKNG